ncbi:MAG: LptF/LptG family permease [Candidatus Bipolaricaulia bacterium]
MLRLVDRYLLREMLWPFLVTLVGFLIFFMLLVIGQLSQYLVDRVVPAETLISLMLYRVPYLFTLALPIAVLFAIFLALGRLGHDRELIALQSGGISLRRLLLPFLMVGLVVGGADFVIGNEVAPWGNRQFLQAYTEMFLGSSSSPQIRDNAFFKGPNDRFFYVKRHDAESDVLHDVLIYDQSGQLALTQDNTYPKVVTADRAQWDGTVWRLQSGVLHAIDEEGRIRYTSRFESMEIRVGEAARQLVLEQRTPQEMSLGQLGERISAFRKTGRSAEALIVQYHAKIAIPAACLVFALFGAPLALLLGPRGRAFGVILGVGFVLVYQGLYFWTAQILGTRGDLPPSWGAWIPNVVFGLIGLAMTWRANHFGRLDVLQRARRFVPFMFVAIVLGSGISVAPVQAQPSSQTSPLEIAAETISVSDAGRQLEAVGNVRARYETGRIEARHLSVDRGQSASWQIRAQSASFAIDELQGRAMRINAVFRRDEGALSPQRLRLAQSASIQFTDGRLSARTLTLKHTDGPNWSLDAAGDVRLEQSKRNQVAEAETLVVQLVSDRDTGEWRLKSARSDRFSGASNFTNDRGKTHRLRFAGRNATMTFDDANNVELIDGKGGNFTTCLCSEDIEDASYSVRAGRMLIRPDEVLVAFNVTARAFGVPIFWAPVYLSPLGDVQKEYPFLPEVGRSTGRGWFAKWRIPFYLDEQTFGHVLIDYYTRHGELGTGIDLQYQLLPGSEGGSLRFYRLTGRGDAISLDWSDRLILPNDSKLALSAGLRTGRLAQKAAKLDTGAKLSGDDSGWNWSVAFKRNQNLVGPNPDPEDLEKLGYRVLERLPELTISSQAVELDAVPLSLSSSISWGRYQEVDFDGTTNNSSRFDGRLNAELSTISVLPGLDLQSSSGYRLTLYEATRRDVWHIDSRLDAEPTTNTTISFRHLYRTLRGQSPFEFDRVNVSHKLTLDANWHATDAVRLQLNTGYDAQAQNFDPLELTANARWGIAQATLGATADLNALSLNKITWQGRLKGDGWSANLDGGYNLASRRFDDLIAKVDLGPRWRAGLRFDPNTLSLERVNARSSWELGDWELQAGSEYDLTRGRLSALQFGIVRKFCKDCWQVGLYGNRQRLWVEAQINAFPTARISYSPTDQSLAFGEDER